MLTVFQQKDKTNETEMRKFKVFLSTFRLSKEERDVFYQVKYDRLQKVNNWVIIASCSLEAALFVFDCLFAKEFSWITFIPRFFIFIPLIAFLVVSKKVNSFKIMGPLSYIMIHACMWTTIWATHYMTDTSYVHESFLAMQLMFLAVGFCAPTTQHIFYHGIMLINIMISATFNRYENFNFLITVSIVCVLAVWLLEFVFESIVLQQYLSDKKAEELTRRDQLTGAYNRKQLVKMCIDDSSELIYRTAGIIIVDIDNFDKLNDSCTHEGGDRILVELCKIIDICIRNDDFCIRWEGDQFAVFIPNQGLARTKEIAERIRNRVNENESAIHTYKVSIGVTVYKGGNYFESIKDAEEALEFAKANGRNMVIAYEDMIKTVN